MAITKIRLNNTQEYDFLKNLIDEEHKRLCELKNIPMGCRGKTWSKQLKVVESLQQKILNHNPNDPFIFKVRVQFYFDTPRYIEHIEAYSKEEAIKIYINLYPNWKNVRSKYTSENGYPSEIVANKLSNHNLKKMKDKTKIIRLED